MRFVGGLGGFETIRKDWFLSFFFFLKIIFYTFFSVVLGVLWWFLLFFSWGNNLRLREPLRKEGGGSELTKAFGFGGSEEV